MGTIHFVDDIADKVVTVVKESVSFIDILTTTSARSTTGQICLQTSKFFSNGVSATRYPLNQTSNAVLQSLLWPDDRLERLPIHDAALI